MIRKLARTVCESGVSSKALSLNFEGRETTAARDIGRRVHLDIIRMPLDLIHSTHLSIKDSLLGNRWRCTTTMPLKAMAGSSLTLANNRQSCRPYKSSHLRLSYSMQLHVQPQYMTHDH